MMDRPMCGACSTRRAGTPLYGTDVRICNPCRRLAVSWCWLKEQGVTEDAIRPRHDPDRPGFAYLCTLCGYYHWTLNLNPPDKQQADAVWALTRYFDEMNFHINVARGWDRIRTLWT